MRIRLIQPPLVQPRYRQLTLPVVGALFGARGFDVEVCDENVGPLDESDTDLVGVTCHVYNAPRAFEIARRFRRRGIPVLMGGTFPTVAPQLVAPYCDSVVVGELEGQAEQIAGDARSGRLAPLYQNRCPPSLQTTPAPDFSLLASGAYLRFNFPIELSRGCRFRCRFCTSNTLFPSPRTRSLRDVERDLAAYDHGLVEIVDVNFLNDLAFLRNVLPLLERAPIPGWMGQTTVADLDADPTLPDALARSRCRAVFVGLESIEPAGLRSIDKAWSKPEAFLRVARRLHRAGVLVQAGIIVGLDSDEPGTLRRTADYLEEARVQCLSYSWLHYYPGTAPYEALRRAGRLLSEDLRDYDGNRPVISPRCISVEQLTAELESTLRRFYGWRSVARRAAHPALRHHKAQLLHHLTINAGLRTYYRTVGRPGAAARAGELATSRAADVLAKGVADGTSRIMDRLLSR